MIPQSIKDAIDEYRVAIFDSSTPSHARKRLEAAIKAEFVTRREYDDLVAIRDSELRTLAIRENDVKWLIAALEPFANLGAGSGPDEQTDLYRIDYGTIRRARLRILTASS